VAAASDFKHPAVHGHNFAISPRFAREFAGNIPLSKNRGRRECRALDAPAAARGV
jgi:hypothetical protein